LSNKRQRIEDDGICFLAELGGQKKILFYIQLIIHKCCAFFFFFEGERFWEMMKKVIRCLVRANDYAQGIANVYCVILCLNIALFMLLLCYIVLKMSFYRLLRLCVFILLLNVVFSLSSHCGVVAYSLEHREDDHAYLALRHQRGMALLRG